MPVVPVIVVGVLLDLDLVDDVGTRVDPYADLVIPVGVEDVAVPGVHEVDVAALVTEHGGDGLRSVALTVAVEDDQGQEPLHGRDLTVIVVVLPVDDPVSVDVHDCDPLVVATVVVPLGELYVVSDLEVRPDGSGSGGCVRDDGSGGAALSDHVGAVQGGGVRLGARCGGDLDLGLVDDVGADAYPVVGRDRGGVPYALLVLVDHAVDGPHVGGDGLVPVVGPDEGFADDADIVQEVVLRHRIHAGLAVAFDLHGEVLTVLARDGILGLLCCVCSECGSGGRVDR